MDLEKTCFKPAAALLMMAATIATVGCSRSFYRKTADRDAYCYLQQNGSGPTWAVPRDFTVTADPRSRFYMAAGDVCPDLPDPTPQLYRYQFPELVTPQAPERTLSRASGAVDLPPPPSKLPGEDPAEDAAKGATSNRDGAAPAVQSETKDSRQSASDPAVQFASGSANAGLVDTAEPLQLLPPAAAPSASAQSGNTASNPSGTVTDSRTTQQDSTAEELPVPPEADSSNQLVMRIPPVPVDAWTALPESCVRRMLEFASVQREYERSYEIPVSEDQLDPARRVTLENIIELALINSREYQTRKELLYRTALALSLQRFDYQLQFLRGSGIDTRYRHNRVAGVTVNTLSTPSTLGLTRTLYTAGQLTTRFANDVVLTFNGTNGYSPFIRSGLLLELTQPILQRDIVFEDLTQAERDVVYAARDFVQFQKRLFRDLAVDYYNLLLTYRSIEINTQDYFSNLAGFNRAFAQYEANEVPRFQVDQFEQNVLRSRGNLINSCNNLERSLDRLKLQVGLPPELPMNVDLSELDSLTNSDEATVIREQVRRGRKSVIQQLESEDSVVAISGAAELARRMLNLSAPVADDSEQLQESRELQILVQLLETEDSRIKTLQNAFVLEQNKKGELTLLPLQIYLRNLDVLESTIESLEKQLQLLRMVTQPASVPREDADMLGDAGLGSSRSQDPYRQLDAQLAELKRKQTDLTGRFRQMPNAQRSQELPRLIAEEQEILATATELETLIAQELGQQGVVLPATPEDRLLLAQSVVDWSLRESFDQATGLARLEVDVDQAMLTALVQRLDLMNERGNVADRWRVIKYAADDLKSVLNLTATQDIRTPATGKNPFDFTFKDSTTSLGLQFDTPLNRRAERNTFRISLINFNASIRNLIELEDNIKFEIRDDLRAITLDQNQYDISIASAALAYERVNSTRLQFALGQGNVSARDFLEAQQAYTQSLSDVARQHIGYIIDRIEFFLDLEQLQVDRLNFWPELRNESYEFLPNVDFAGTVGQPYGGLPCGPCFSDCIRRIENYPAGTPQIFREPEILQVIENTEYPPRELLRFDESQDHSAGTE